MCIFYKKLFLCGGVVLGLFRLSEIKASGPAWHGHTFAEILDQEKRARDRYRIDRDFTRMKMSFERKQREDNSTLEKGAALFEEKIILLNSLEKEIEAQSNKLAALQLENVDLKSSLQLR